MRISVDNYSAEVLPIAVYRAGLNIGAEWDLFVQMKYCELVDQLTSDDPGAVDSWELLNMSLDLIEAMSTDESAGVSLTITDNEEFWTITTKEEATI